MTIRVLINGANGKMGQAAVKTFSHHPDFILAGTTGSKDDLAAEIRKTKANVVVDLTNAAVVFKNTQTIINAGACPVIGTSGLMQTQVKELQALCAQLKLGGVIAPNFSLGAVLLMKHAQAIAKYFPDVEIIEMHHNGKLDSPSGTAVRTAELLAAARTTIPSTPADQRETVAGARGAVYQDIHIHAVRIPGLIAQQQVIFGGTGETFTLKHDTLDRQCFMPGIELACKKAVMLKELVYGLEHLL